MNVLYYSEYYCLTFKLKCLHIENTEKFQLNIKYKLTEPLHSEE